MHKLLATMFPNYKKPETKYMRGLSLAEVMMVMSASLILASASAPSIARLLRGSPQTTRQQLVSDLGYARTQSINRNVRVLVCSGDKTGCSYRTDWGASGWIVCYSSDTNASAVHQCDQPPADGANPNPLIVRPPATSGSVTGPDAPVFYTHLGTQGVLFNPGVRFEISSAAAGTKSGNMQNAIPVAQSGVLVLASGEILTP